MTSTLGKKPEYVSRLQEAKEQIQNGHNRSAVESATGGIELLMEDLFAELYDKLTKEDIQRYLYLKSKYDEYFDENKKRDRKFTFGTLINFYKKEDIIDELYAVYRYEFTHFNIENLFKLNDIRNKCVHENHQPTTEEALLVCNNLNMFLRETNRAPNAEYGEAVSFETLTAKWRQDWEERIISWTTDESNQLYADPIANLVDLFMLATGLIGDPRISHRHKLSLIAAVNYVMNPDDLMPEEQEGVFGLLDDVAVLAFSLNWIINNSEIEEQIYIEHWAEENNPIQFIDQLQIYIHEIHDTFFSEEIWARLQPIVTNGPEALWKDSFTEEHENEDTIKNIFQFITEEESDSSDSWYQKWRKRIKDWADENSNTDIANLVIAIPDLFILVTRLMRDGRVGPIVKTRLLAVSAYVVSPFDLVPEGLLGVAGLPDDAGALVLTCFWLIQLINIDQELLREHWPGENDPIEAILELHQQINDVADLLFVDKTGIWGNLKERFGNKSEPNILGFRAKISRIFGRGKINTN